MSFAIWKNPPPFPEEQLTHQENCDERIYVKVGDPGIWKLLSEVAKGEVPVLWCISSEGLPTDEQVTTKLTPPPVTKTPEDKFAEFLVANPDVDTLISDKKVALTTPIL